MCLIPLSVLANWNKCLNLKRLTEFKVSERANMLCSIGGALLFGALSQILTGVSMATHYATVVSKAFASVYVFMHKFKCD